MIKKFLDLGLQPLANKYLRRSRKLIKKNNELYHLEVMFDSNTKLVSLNKKIPVKKMFNNKYPYRSSMSKTMTLAFKKLSKKIKARFSPKLILEIGSNDGALIQNFNKEKVICVEPCGNLAKITKKKGYFTYSNYWNISLAKKIKRKFNLVDVVYSANTITHIENLDNVFKAISHVLSKNGVLIIEDPSLLECLKKVSYDQFYNEHIYLFSAISLSNIIRKFDLEIFDIEKLSTHGGSLRYFIKRKANKTLTIKKNVLVQIRNENKYRMQNFSTYKKFSDRVHLSKNKLKNVLESLKSQKKSIIGYGATAKVTTILNFCKIDNKLIDYFVDTTPDKKDKYVPGTNIIVKKYNKKLINPYKFIFLGAWNFKNEIFRKEKKFIIKGGKFITHIPFPKII
tara:strand:- start:570 stop:1760 length:1191 start_codon:yes stop_codon:yes gene_type:complete